MTDAPPLAQSPSPPARGPSLETMGMTKTFGRFTALDNVSIMFRRGRFMRFWARTARASRRSSNA